MKRVTYGPMAYYQFEGLQDDTVQHGVFTRLGGVSKGCYASLNLSRSTGDTAEAVQANRNRMNDVFNLKYEDTLTSWLVHGNAVRVVDWADRSQNDVHADAMVTNTPGLALTLRFADCVPVLFHDPVKKAIGIAHAGWRGYVVKVMAETVQAMQQAYGSRPQDIVACVGPSIGPSAFEVGEDVAEQIQSAVHAPIIQRQDANGQPLAKPKVDLWRAAHAQLHEAGLDPNHIEIAALCTASNTHEWFSHRAEQGRTGRFGAMVMLGG